MAEGLIYRFCIYIQFFESQLFLVSGYVKILLQYYARSIIFDGSNIFLGLQCPICTQIIEFSIHEQFLWVIFNHHFEMESMLNLIVFLGIRRFRSLKMEHKVRKLFFRIDPVCAPRTSPLKPDRKSSSREESCKVSRKNYVPCREHSQIEDPTIFLYSSRS